MNVLFKTIKTIVMCEKSNILNLRKRISVVSMHYFRESTLINSDVERCLIPAIAIYLSAFRMQGRQLIFITLGSKPQINADILQME